MIAALLYRAQNTTTAERCCHIGLRATVIECIPQGRGRFGKISFSLHDCKHSAPAVSEDGNEISRNQTVEIVNIDKNTYYVRRKELL
ncbi:MAG: NfeD family protein [Defluviitaleaceae bacterium]|nr:NfeD family protein [Defluviitaleaceae bacterium]